MQRMLITRVRIKRRKSPKKPLLRHSSANLFVAHNISHVVITNEGMPENQAINPTTHPQQNNNANNLPHPPNITHLKQKSKPPIDSLKNASCQTPVTSNTALAKIFMGACSPPFSPYVVNKQTTQQHGSLVVNKTTPVNRKKPKQ